MLYLAFKKEYRCTVVQKAGSDFTFYIFVPYCLVSHGFARENFKDHISVLVSDNGVWSLKIPEVTGPLNKISCKLV